MDAAGHTHSFWAGRPHRARTRFLLVLLMSGTWFVFVEPLKSRSVGI